MTTQDDVNAAKDQIKKDQEAYNDLKGSIDALHKKEVAAAHTPEEQRAADDKAGKLNADADENFRNTDRQNKSNLERMEKGLGDDDIQFKEPPPGPKPAPDSSSKNKGEDDDIKK